MKSASATEVVLSVAGEKQTYEVDSLVTVDGEKYVLHDATTFKSGFTNQIKLTPVKSSVNVDALVGKKHITLMQKRNTFGVKDNQQHYK